MTERFDGSFTQQLAIPEAGIDAAMRVLKSGRLHRYNVAAGDPGEAALVEEDFAAWLGARYCLALASGGAAMSTALRAAGVGPGDAVLTNAFTLAPVPGAVAAVGGRAIFVESTDNLTIDFDDLARKAGGAGARVLLISHMRGHLCDMERLVAVCEAHGLTLIEDCAHTMGGAWLGRKSGLWGALACFSTQTYKHMNSGEGGFLTGDDPALMARAVILSGSYMNYERHRAAPPPEAFSAVRYDMPNISSRMDNLRAAILRPQIARLDDDCAAWTARYRVIEEGLRGLPQVALTRRPQAETFVGSSIQFRLPGWSPAQIQRLLAGAAARGVELKWFGAPEAHGFTATHHHWRFAPAQQLPATDAIMATLLDMRIPLTFSLDDCRLIARVLAAEIGGGGA